MEETNTTKLIDCTFRDGGYYNNWFFDKALVEKTLGVLSRLPIAYVEIGFRRFDDDSKDGPLAYTTDEYIEGLIIPQNINLAVMVMLKDFAHLDDSCFKKLLPPADKSRIQLVRIASPVKDIEKIIYVTQVFKDLGYSVANNITHISAYSENDTVTCFEKLKNAKADMIMIADTFGNLMPYQLKKIFKILHDNFSKAYGFHAHDNRGLARANIIAAIEAGATYIDATIMGMGRGAGNSKLESLLLDLPNSHEDIDLQPLMNLIETHFLDLKRQYRWGYSPLYHYGTNAGAHPMVLQNLLSNPNINFDKFMKTLKVEMQ
jgi:4-hydroxy 2-oxovalerate aldolase